MRQGGASTGPDPSQARSPIPFVKMHGLGNDYVFLDCLDAPPPTDPSGLSRRISDRHRGVGSDGLILIERGETSPFRMRMWNADGSRGEMCGNGIRCLGKYLYDRGKTREREIDVDTDAGVRRLAFEVDGDRVSRVTVDMGTPSLDPASIPVRFDGDRMVDAPVEAAGRTFAVTAVSVGNPHAIAFLDEDPAGFDLPRYGPAMATHAIFPEGVNAEFVRVEEPTSIRMRVWERGSGETQACGTGACAVLVAAATTGRTGRRATVHLPGGDLEIAWGDDDRIRMTGPAVESFSGTFPG